MDFFRHQDQARHKTGVLVLFFILAVVLIVLAVNVVAFMLFGTGDDLHARLNHWMDNVYWEHPTALAILLIFFGSLKRYLALSDGGKAVAEMVGAQAVDMDSASGEVRQYINVVSEMSIASGVPMPSLYIMEREQAINAFVAGFRPTEAVLVVTRGAIDELSRDQLQGVVAHEFSHILNGDMRINIRLMAILAGILTIGQFGRVVMRSASHGRSSRNSGPLVIIGLVFFLIGYIGLFFGRLIKAAISRQREYLADASAVQFTRNPKGIAGALYKIKENTYGGLLESNRAEEMSHMCFTDSVHMMFGALLATHPDLDVRISTIDPSYLKLQKARAITEKRKIEQEEIIKTTTAGAANVTGMIGNPQPQHLAYAAVLYQSLSQSLLSMLHKPESVQCILYAMLISRMDQQQGLSYLQKTGGQVVMHKTSVALGLVTDVDPRQRLPLVDLALPVLKKLTINERQKFIKTMNGIARLDRRISLFEFVLLIILQQHLDEGAEKVDHVKYHSFKHLLEDVRVLISLLVQTSRQSGEKTAEVFHRAMKTFVSDNVEMIPAKECRFEMLSNALNKLNGLSPLLKKTLITVCVDCVEDDGIIMPAEGELLRAITESLDCPMPPLLFDA